MVFCNDISPNCDTCFEVEYGNCNDVLTLSLGLTPSTNFFLNLIDKFDIITQIDITTDVSGDFTITQTWTKFFGDIELQIFSDSGRTILVTVTQNAIIYSCVLLVQELSGQNQIPIPETACQVLLKNLSDDDENTCILPNYDFSDTDVTDNLTAQQQTDLIALLCAALSALTCLELNDNTTGLTITQRNFIQRVNPLKTGQTTSFRTGDDGDLEEGRGVDFFTLDCNNEFGNTLRFTNTIGTQDMTGIGGALVNYIIDHASGLGWSRVLNASAGWDANIDNATASAVNGFSDWRIPNKNELQGIINDSINGSRLNYAPFSIISTTMDTSTTVPSSTTRRYTYFLMSGEIRFRDKPSTSQSIHVRNHY